MSGPADIRSNLDRLAARVFSGAVAEGSLLRLTGGASQQTWSVDIVTPAGTLPLILRHIPGDRAEIERTVGPETEAILMRLAGAHGVPEPGVRHVLEPADGLGRGFLSDRIAGETLARRILRDAEFDAIRPRLAGLSGAAMAGIHAIPLDQLPSLLVKYAQDELADLRASYRTTGARVPTFEAAFRWLEDHMPQRPTTPCLVHGDFRNGNLIFGPEGIRAVLDWELAHLGDPAQDLGWITVNSWRFGARDHPVGGFGSIEDMMAGYVAAGGAAIDTARVLFWQALGSLRWGVMCRQMSWRDETAPPLVVERAMIGRRVSETELDLLDIVAPDRRP